MALKVKDALGSDRELKTSILLNEHTPHHHVDSSVLPANAAKETTLASIDGKVATQVTLNALSNKVTTCDTGAVAVSSSALPAGAATETTLLSIDEKVATDTLQSAGNVLLGTIDTSVGTGNALLTTIDQDTGNIATSTSTIAGAVSGNEMQVSLVSLTSSGAATAGNQSTSNTLLGTIDTSIGTSNTLLGTIDTDTGTIAGAVSGGEMQVGLATLGGAATEANQTTIDTSIGTVNTSVGTVNTSIGVTNTVLATIDSDTGALVNCIDGVGGTELKVDLIDLGGAATEATLSNIDTDTGNIATSTGTLAGAVTASRVQVDLVGVSTAATEATLSDIDTDTGNIATSTSTIAGAVTGNEMQVDIVSVVIPTSVLHGYVAPAASGTAEPLKATSQAITSGVNVKAYSANAGLVYVGDSTVTNAAGSYKGFELSAQESVFIECDDLNTVYVDVDTQTDGVCWIAS